MFTITEIIGYLASILVLISFTIKEINKIRSVNIVGCVLFIIYGILLKSIPVIITNVSIVIIHLYYLFYKKNNF